MNKYEIRSSHIWNQKCWDNVSTVIRISDFSQTTSNHDNGEEKDAIGLVIQRRFSLSGEVFRLNNSRCESLHAAAMLTSAFSYRMKIVNFTKFGSGLGECQCWEKPLPNLNLNSFGPPESWANPSKLFLTHLQPRGHEPQHAHEKANLLVPCRAHCSDP